MGYMPLLGQETSTPQGEGSSVPGRHVSWLPLNGDVGCGDPTLPGTMHPADSVLDHAENPAGTETEARGV